MQTQIGTIHTYIPVGYSSNQGFPLSGRLYTNMGNWRYFSPSHTADVVN